MKKPRTTTPKPEKVKTAQVKTGCSKRCAEKQNNGAVIPTTRKQ